MRRNAVLRYIFCLLLLTCNVSYSSARELKVMSLNVWNFDNGPNWDKRKREIANMVRASEADFVGWQELRKDDKGRDMLEDLKELLPEFAYHGYAVGQEYEHSEEGVGFSSRWPVRAVEKKRLALGEGPDANRRVCLRTILQLPKDVEIATFVTHFSYEREQQMGNAKEVKEYTLASKARGGQIILGDLNIYLNYDAPVRELMQSGVGASRRVLFQDVWEIWQHATGVRERDGYTFSSWQPKNRADRILARGLSLVRVEILGRSTGKTTAASDHCALMATFDVPFEGNDDKVDEKASVQDITTGEASIAEESSALVFALSVFAIAACLLVLAYFALGKAAWLRKLGRGDGFVLPSTSHHDVGKYA